MSRLILLVLSLLSLCGCVNMYRHVDRAPDGRERKFLGVAQYVKQKAPLHVIQVHGMGDHSFGNDCGPKSENLVLQDRIAEDLHYVLDAAYGVGEQPIRIDATARAGTYSVRHFVDPKGENGDLYFSCVTWGESGRVIKRGMLELDEDFLELNANEQHRALINREAKRFVNRSFSDPVLYLGPMGGYIRRVVWEGLRLSVQEHGRFAANVSPPAVVDTAQRANAFAKEVPVVIISDSLGSRIVFDALCSEQGVSCGNAPAVGKRTAAEPAPGLVQGESVNGTLATGLASSIKSVFMLANQLPLLELGYMAPPGPDVSLEELVENTSHCYQPLVVTPTAGTSIQVVAFTDANDALSYHLTERFQRRCGAMAQGGQGANADPATRTVEIVNVTLPNPRLRWLFVYSDLADAHSSGFKTNPRAIKYLVKGNQ